MIQEQKLLASTFQTFHIFQCLIDIAGIRRVDGSKNGSLHIIE
jgi:hypothetical protein